MKKNTSRNVFGINGMESTSGIQSPSRVVAACTPTQRIIQKLPLTVKRWIVIILLTGLFINWIRKTINFFSTGVVVSTLSIFVILFSTLEVHHRLTLQSVLKMLRRATPASFGIISDNVTSVMLSDTLPTMASKFVCMVFNVIAATLCEKLITRHCRRKAALAE